MDTPQDQESQKPELSDEAMAARESHDQERQDAELDAARAERAERLGHDIRVTEDVRESHTEELRTEAAPSESQGEPQQNEPQQNEPQGESQSEGSQTDSN